MLDRALDVGRNPLVGSPVKQRPGVRKVLRYSYLVYYDVNEEKGPWKSYAPGTVRVSQIAAIRQSFLLTIEALDETAFAGWKF